MSKRILQWEVVNKTSNKKMSVEDVVETLLKNRGIRTESKKKEFFYPTNPNNISITSLRIDKNSLRKAIKRIEKAISNKEKIIIYGDYDTDGISATAIIWEYLYSLNKNVVPYIPDRFSEGYGINPNSVKKIIKLHPDVKLLITVDNGIVALDAVEVARELKIDVIITDHHQKDKRLPKANCVIHTDMISGSGLAWILVRELRKHYRGLVDSEGLELAAVGTIADQLPLIGPNRSFAKYGLRELNSTKRVGLLALFEEAGIRPGVLGTYEINYLIAPRLNAMGRMEHAIDSLRLICTKNSVKAHELAATLGKTNKERQRVVDDVIIHARDTVQHSQINGAIILSSEKYHEGVIGLAASKLVDEFWRPAIVLSRGEKFSKASARSVAGFNIIETIRKLDDIIEGGGGHPMAAGFTIETEKIEMFTKKFDEISLPLLTPEVLTKKIKIDTELPFDLINETLVDKLSEFEPSGIGNPRPTFFTESVEVVDARTVGQSGKHLKLVLRNKGFQFDAIGFGLGENLVLLNSESVVDIAYSVEKNVWNGNESLQIRLKDIHFNEDD